jgi:cytochrome c-type biogenesis protein CcmH
MRRLRTRAALPIAALLALSVTLSIAQSTFDPAEFDEAATTILCDCGCHPQSVADCTCGRAAEMREEIRTMVAAGMTGEEVIADYVARYGEKILIAPDASGFNLLAWIGPFLLLFVGVGSLVWLVRRWSRSSPGSPSEDVPAAYAPADDDPYAARLRREIEELQ